MSYEYEEDYDKIVTEAADTWLKKSNRDVMGGLHRRLFLYFIPGGESIGSFRWAYGEDQPDPSWEVADPEPFKVNMTRDQVRARVWSVGRRLPILAH